MKTRKTPRASQGSGSPGQSAGDGSDRLAAGLVDIEERLLASAEALHAAGVLESIEHDPATGRGVITLTPAAHKLMLAGRLHFGDPGFLGAWLSGEAEVVRDWIDSEATRVRAEKDRGPRPPGNP